MRIEPIGCYLPYLETKQVVQVLNNSKPSCFVCKGIPDDVVNKTSHCKCSDDLYWDGNKCVPSSLCPCVENHISYAVGSKFSNKECEDCVCILGGRSSCTPKKCPLCEGDLRPVMSSGCFCKCEPCPKYQKLCPSSGDCIPEMLWCNGVHDCTDDEDETCKVQFVVEPEKKIKNDTPVFECPKPICPPNMQLKIIEKKERKMSAMFTSTTTKVMLMNDGDTIMKTKIITSSEEIIPMSNTEINMNAVEENLCNEFTCIPIVPKVTMSNDSVICVEPKCPDNFDVEVDRSNVKSGDCFKYTCVLKPQKDDVCEISGSLITTFDGTEFKYDLCSHILARDVTNSQWMITVQMQCNVDAKKICRKVITIKDQVAPATLSIMPNMKLNFNGFEYTVQQLINSPVCKASFVISMPGNTILIVSQRHGVWVLYDDSGYVKIGMSSKYINTVDGLCGYYNGIPSDDKRSPNGTLIPSTIKFGDSWYDGQIPKEQCQPRTCPLDIQKKSLALCNNIKHPAFVKCGKSVNYKQFVSKCIETVCDCLQANASDVNACKCLILQDFVKKCLTVNPNLQLNSWRAIHQCEITCPTPLVHLDCYKRRCEPSCTTLSNDDCPLIPDACFSGCYCPESTVRKDNKCISVNECKDCVCNSFGPAKYFTYDRNSFTFDGNCTYLLSRDILSPDMYTFQVYVTMDDCQRLGYESMPKASICAKSYHVLHNNHNVHIIHSNQTSNGEELLVDGAAVTKLPFKDNWLNVRLQRGQVFMLTLPTAHVELTVNFQAPQFSLEVPSVKYGNKMEGLCGNCDDNANNDLQPNKAKLKPAQIANETFNLADVMKSWQADEPRLGSNINTCNAEPATVPKTKLNCTEQLPGAKNLCLILYDKLLFGKCNTIIDPATYVEACQQDTCRLGHAPNVICDTLAAYSRECLRLGICLDWRGPELCPYTCPATMKYKPCACTRTCETIASISQYDAVIMNTNSIVKTVKEEEMCDVQDQLEGCFCPAGQILENGKCIDEEFCIKCDDKDHLPGEKWQKDNCTKCECSKSGKVACLTQQCLVEENICADDYKPKKIFNEGECCAKYICVPEIKSPTAKICMEPLLPLCGPGQFKMQKIGADGCPQYVCACKPKEECNELVQPRELKAGEAILIEETGCCPTQKIICDKSKCPEKLVSCAEKYYEVVIKQLPNDCCPSYICELPKDLCLVDYGFTPDIMVKKVHEKWQHPTDPCKHEFCNYGPNGTAQVLTTQEICNKQCPSGFTYTVAQTDKCCGECQQTSCVWETKTYAPNEIWHSVDNCTIYKCEQSAATDKSLIISSVKESCPDVSSCAPQLLVDNGGCCKYCANETFNIEDKSLCLPVSLAANETIKLVQVYKSGIGNCINIEPIQGFTECSGACASGSKYNTALRSHDKICNCCNIHNYNKIQVKLHCENNATIYENIDIPSACHCAPCTDSATFKQPKIDVRFEPFPLAQLHKGNSLL